MPEPELGPREHPRAAWAAGALNLVTWVLAGWSPKGSLTPEAERPSTHGKPHYRPSPHSGGSGVRSGLEQSQAAQQQYRSSCSHSDSFTRGWSGSGQLEKMVSPTYWASGPKAPPASVPPPAVVCCVAHRTSRNPGGEHVTHRYLWGLSASPTG